VEKRTLLRMLKENSAFSTAAFSETAPLLLFSVFLIRQEPLRENGIIKSKQRQQKKE